MSISMLRLWTCYKQALGENFGEYGLKMYRYAKDYYKQIMQMERFTNERKEEATDEQSET